MLVWDVQTATITKKLVSHEHYVLGVAISFDGKLYASCSADRTIIIWSSSNDKPIHIISKHYDWVNCVNFSLDGKNLVSCSSDTTVQLFNTETG